jgi:hypothetical protein
MTEDEAYQKGQADMRRKIERLWAGWYIDGLSMHCTKYRHRAAVPVKIRAHCKIEPMAQIEGGSDETD